MNHKYIKYVHKIHKKNNNVQYVNNNVQNINNTNSITPLPPQECSPTNIIKHSPCTLNNNFCCLEIDKIDRTMFSI